MMVEEELARVFRKNGWKWKTKGNPDGIVPDEDDITAALEEAAKNLATLPAGAQCIVGRLIVVKTHKTNDVYVYVGEYD
jgi:hypothetical protein